jgi:hypothetical protein
MELKGSLPSSQTSVICSYPIYGWVFWVVSFLQASKKKLCAFLISPMHAICPTILIRTDDLLMQNCKESYMPT